MPDVDDRIASTTAFVPAIPEKLTDDELLAALRTIPDKYQQVIVLCDVEEMTCKEISQALDTPLGTVMSKLHRGRTLLRAGLTHGEQQRGRTHHGMPSRQRARRLVFERAAPLVETIPLTRRRRPVTRGSPTVS